MPHPIDFYFDYASPWAFLANEVLDKYLPGAEVRYKPIYLRGTETFAKGLPYTAAKMRYMMQDFHRCAEREGVSGHVPKVFPINGLYALRGALWAQENGGFDTYHQTVFREVWQHDGNISDKNVVIALAVKAGLDKATFTEGFASDAIKEQLKTRTADAVALGLFGVPTFFVNGEMFWGYDRLPFVARAAGVTASG